MPQDNPYNAGLELLEADVATATEKIAWIGGVAIASLKDNAQYRRALDQLGLGGSVDVVTDITNLVQARTARAEAQARRLAKRVAQLEAENAQLRDRLARAERTPEWLAEALNSGDGTYRP